MGRVLKSDHVEYQGRCAVGPIAPAGAPEGEAVAAKTGAAKIVEARPDYTVVEVVCDCGQTLHIRCEHP